MCIDHSSTLPRACCRKEPCGRSSGAWCACRRLNTAISFLQPIADDRGNWRDSENLYATGSFPGTARRMQAFEKFAPQLAACALNKLGLTAEEREQISHVIVTSCTGLYAPGLDYDIVDHLGLNPSVERTMIGFMGCYAAINALKSAHHIVRSVPEAHVLDFESGAVLSAHAGNAGTRSVAVLPPLRRWLLSLPGKRQSCGPLHR